jgi:hypothetical protein
LLDLLDKISPKYLNSSTLSIFLLLTYIYLAPFTNIACVLDIFMCRSFSTQKFAKQSISCYKSAGEGEIRTKSSAKASKNSYNDAIVYFVLLLPSMLHR